MSEYVDFPEEFAKSLWDDMMLGPILEDGLRRLEEVLFDKIDSRIRVITFSREHEPPHFLLEFQRTNCRYNICTGEPIDNVPIKINRFRINIKNWYNENRKRLIDFYNAHLPDTAPPQAKAQC